MQQRVWVGDVAMPICRRRSATTNSDIPGVAGRAPGIYNVKIHIIATRRELSPNLFYTLTLFKKIIYKGVGRHLKCL